MDRLIATNSVVLANADTAPVTGTPQYATNGNPVLGTPATVWPAYQYNAIQEEIVHAITASGQTLDRTNNTQLSTALSRFQGQGQCRLTLSGANLLLSPKDGNNLNINGTPQVIPAAGVTLGPGALLAPVNISTVAVASNVVTVVTTGSHGLVTGNSAWVNSSNLGMINGTVTVVNSTTFTIPFTHANLGAAGDTGTTGALYYVYAFMAAGVMTLEAVPIPHVTNATTGVEQKSGDATRSLVGLAITVAGPAFIDTSTQTGVLSWFNKARKAITVPFTSSQTTTSGSAVELSTSFRALFLDWGIDAVEMSAGISGSNTNASSCQNNTNVAVDSAAATVEDVLAVATSNTTGQSIGANLWTARTLSEGFHYTTLLGAVSAGTGTWTGNATAGNRTVNKVAVRG